MSRQKSMMQNITTVTTTSASPAQAGTDVLRVGNNRSGVVFLDVYNTSGTAVIAIQTTADDVNGSSNPASPDTWISLATFSGITTFTSMKVTITDLGESIRWRVTTVPTGAGITFRLIAFLSDQN